MTSAHFESMRNRKLSTLVGFLTWMVLATLICFAGLPAQTKVDSLDPDQLLMVAREKAFGGDREGARRLCRIILSRNPSYLDAKVLIGRTFAWDGNRAEARSILQDALTEQPRYLDALYALADVELWDSNFPRALELADQGLSISPRDEELLLRKAKALNSLGRDQEALVVLLKVQEINPTRGEITTLLESIKTGSVMNSAAVIYGTDFFSEVYSPMHYTSVQLSRRTQYGTMYGRLNLANRFNSRGVQIETDLYPRLTDGIYAYLNYGYSSSDLFPRHRAGGEVYTKLPASFETSVGLRYLYFNASSSVTMYTGTLGYYFGNFWVSFRPYVIPGNSGVSNSADLTLRRYIGEAETYLSVHGGAGFSADQRLIQSSAGFGGTELFYLKSQTAGVGWQQNLSAMTLLNTTIDVTHQELSREPGKYVMMYSLSVTLRARF